jgi:delta-1-pyrroline-5-carboxylate synthetase
MQAKVEAATWAWRNGVGVVIANGSRPQVISEVMSGKRVGTFITDAESRSADVESIAGSVRAGGRALAVQPAQHRREIIEKLAALLVERQDDIISANKKDVQLAKANGTSPALVNRLSLTPAKLKGLSEGLLQIAAGADQHLGRVVKRTKVSLAPFW